MGCQAPSTSLAISILRLHNDDQRCGHAILRLVQQLSVRLKASISEIAVDHSLLIQSVIRRFCLDFQDVFVNPSAHLNLILL